MDTPDTSIFSLPVLVVGAGVAGLTAALDLARIGAPVHLVERDSHLGGQVMRLDKLYPSDHCAFCPVWTDGAACLEHPLITVHRRTSLEDLQVEGGQTTAVLSVQPSAIDQQACVFCGLCKEACEAKGVSGAIRMRQPGLQSDPSASPVAFIDPELCSRCGECAASCPVNAVDVSLLDKPAANLRLKVADVIFASGFTEQSPAAVVEYYPENCLDVFAAMDFEAWTSEAGPNSGVVKRRSNGAAPRSIAFIQCAGARDQRFLSYCAAVCCMHALKQARWIKRRIPGASVAIFFTDLRAVGKGYEAYARAAAAEGVQLIRGRPGLVFPLAEDSGSSTLAVRYEDTVADRVITAEFDMVVLNGGLKGCPLPGESALGQGPEFLPDRGCGYCREPADVSQAVIQGARAAALAAARLMAGSGGVR